MATDLNMKAFNAFKAAIANDAQQQINAGKSALARYRPYIDVYAKAKPDERDGLWGVALEVLNAARERVVAYRKAQHDPNYNDVAEVSAVRVSEFRRIMAFGAYKCAPTVLNYFNDMHLNFDDLLTVVKYCTTEKPAKGERNGKPKPQDVAAPSKAQCLNAIKLRHDEKKNKGNGDGKARPKDATKAVDTVTPLAKALLLWFNGKKDLKAKASKQIDIIVRAAAELQSIAKSA